MNRNQLGDQLTQALNRKAPQHEEARRIAAERSSRDTHPTTGSKAIMQQAAGGAAPRQVSSLNTSDGSPAFCFGLDGFGWGQGTLDLP